MIVSFVQTTVESKYIQPCCISMRIDKLVNLKVLIDYRGVPMAAIVNNECNLLKSAFGQFHAVGVKLVPIKCVIGPLVWSCVKVRIHCTPFTVAHVNV